ncbi:pyruvate ferredoxin oxidoreductase [Candidatus Aerophobetes bacterium]|nr:pyruvate ferredoxin oxidoreductase [Candidatus Aerophobetes bacterium]
MAKIVAMTGDEIAAEAMRQINPDVVAAYPITPQTEIVQNFSQFVADGLVDTEMVRVESEHSAMSACIGAAAAGARAMTATCANGLALMWEVLYIAASYRLPIVMAVANRALSGPINIHCDHSDSMGARDSGWIQLYSENCQEVYDNLIQAVKIAEDPQVLLPVMVCFDGFIISHGTERAEILEDEKVKEFVGEFKKDYPLLDIKNPVTYGPLDLFDYYFEHKRQQIEAIQNSYPVIERVGKEYEKLSGRSYGLVEGFNLDESEFVIMAIGSTAGTVKATIQELKEKGVNVGLLKIRCFRPFPQEKLQEILKDKTCVAVMDRAASFGAVGGPLFLETRSALYDLDKKPLLVNYIYGLGGREVTVEHIKKVVYDLEKIKKSGKIENLVNYLGVRE